MKSRIIAAAIVACCFAAWPKDSLAQYGTYSSRYGSVPYLNNYNRPGTGYYYGSHLVPLHASSANLTFGVPITTYRLPPLIHSHSGHYDYHPGSYQRHGGHFDYVPPHYDYHSPGHRSGHHHR